MQSLLLILFCPFIFYTANAQVGIGTTNPNASIDIRSSNETTPANTDGILIPQADAFPGTSPTAAQDGMLLYITGDGAQAKGFYYWDQAGPAWVAVAGGSVERIDDLIDGKSDSDGTDNGSSIFLGLGAGANDDENSNQNVGIGRIALSNNTTAIGNTGVGYAALSSVQTNGGNTAIGNRALESNLGLSNTAIGSYSLQLNENGTENVAIGSQTLQNNVSGNNNIGVGTIALFNNDGNNNLAIGNLAVTNLMTSDNNIAIGNESGQFISDGDNNIFIGYQAGQGSGPHTKSGNIFIGNQAGRLETNSDKLYIENTSSASPLIYGEFDTDIVRINGTFQINNPTTTGYVFPTTRGTANQIMQTDAAGTLTWVANTDIGAERINDLIDGKSDNDGTDNGSSVFLGLDAGNLDDESDNRNIGIGLTALALNTTGEQNTAIGYGALSANDDGTENTAIGYFALSDNSTGYVNTAIGAQALGLNDDGIGNVAIGAYALNVMTSGNSNVALGYGALSSTDLSSNSVAIGYEALTTSLNDNNVAIGTSALRNNSGTRNTVIGNGAGFDSTGAASDNIFLGNEAGYNETGSEKLYIENTNADADNALIYGEFDNNILRVNGELEIGSIGVNDNLAIARLAANRLGLDGDIVPYNNVNFDLGNNNATEHWDDVVAVDFVNFSDSRLKNSIAEIPYGLQTVLSLNPVTYKYNKNISIDDRFRLGLIAQEVEAVIPEVVFNEDIDANPETGEKIVTPSDYKSMSYVELVPVLIKAIQEQQEQIEQQNIRIATLERKSQN